MARRARTQNHLPMVLLGIVGLGAIFLLGWMFLGKKTEKHEAVAVLNVRDYINSASSLRGNSYRVVGRVDERLDRDWTGSDGRIFSIAVEEGSEQELIPIQVPQQLNNINIDRGVEYLFIVTVGDQGILIADAVDPS